jgi:DNA-binding transcriptional ArsR family regulator
LSLPAVSHHLKILRDAKLLIGERRGTQRRYALNDAEYPRVLGPMADLVDLITVCVADQSAGKRSG